MENSKKTKRATKRERCEALAAFRESGMTQKAFAESRGLNTATFRSWLYADREAEPGRDGGFIEVAASPPTWAMATLRFVDGTTIEFPVAELERAALSLAREAGRR